LAYEDQSTTTEQGRPAAATTRTGAETSESESEEARTTAAEGVDGDLIGRGKARTFAFAARRGEAGNSLLAPAAGRDARVSIDARAIVIAADIFLRGMRRGSSKKGDRRRRERSRKWVTSFF
jgi:hypothetical protein